MSRTLVHPTQSRIAADSEMCLVIQLVQIGAASILPTVAAPCLWLIERIASETSGRLFVRPVAKFPLRDYVCMNLAGYYIANDEHVPPICKPPNFSATPSDFLCLTAEGDFMDQKLLLTAAYTMNGGVYGCIDRLIYF